MTGAAAPSPPGIALPLRDPGARKFLERRPELALVSLSGLEAAASLELGRAQPRFFPAYFVRVSFGASVRGPRVELGFHSRRRYLVDYFGRTGPLLLAAGCGRVPEKAV